METTDDGGDGHWSDWNSTDMLLSSTLEIYPNIRDDNDVNGHFATNAVWWVPAVIILLFAMIIFTVGYGFMHNKNKNKNKNKKNKSNNKKNNPKFENNSHNKQMSLDSIKTDLNTNPNGNKHIKANHSRSMSNTEKIKNIVRQISLKKNQNSVDSVVHENDSEISIKIRRNTSHLSDPGTDDGNGGCKRNNIDPEKEEKNRQIRKERIKKMLAVSMDNASPSIVDESKYQETKNGVYDFDYGQVHAQIHRNSCVNVYHRRHSSQNSDNININLANNLNINNGHNSNSNSNSNSNINISYKRSKSAIISRDSNNRGKLQLMNNQSHPSKNLDISYAGDGYVNINNGNGNGGRRASANINLRKNTLSHDQSRSYNSLHSMASPDITHTTVSINSVNSSFNLNHNYNISGSHNCSNIVSHDNSSAGQRNHIDSVIEHNIVERIIDDPPILTPGDSADHYSNLELINSIIHVISDDENHDNNNNNNNNNNKISKQHLNFNDNLSIAESDKSSLQIEGHIKGNVNNININNKMRKFNSRSDAGIWRAGTKPKNKEKEKDKQREREKDRLHDEQNVNNADRRGSSNYIEYGPDIDIDIDNILQPSAILMVTPSAAQGALTECTPSSNASIAEQDYYITAKGPDRNGNSNNNNNNNNGRNDSIISSIISRDEMINNNNIRLEDVGATFLKIGVLRRGIVRAQRVTKNISDQNEKFRHLNNIDVVLKIINKNTLDANDQSIIIDLYEAIKTSKNEDLGYDLLDTLATMNLVDANEKQNDYVD